MKKSKRALIGLGVVVVIVIFLLPIIPQFDYVVVGSEVITTEEYCEVNFCGGLYIQISPYDYIRGFIQEALIK